jgi:hypothetical protein
MPTVQEHEKAVATAQAALDKAKDHAAKAAAAAAAPRPAGNIVMDIMRWLIARNGNHPVAEGLLKELEAVSGLTYDPETGLYQPTPAAPAASEAETGSK